MLKKETDGSYTLRITKVDDIAGIDDQVEAESFEVVEEFILEPARRLANEHFNNRARSKEARYRRLSPADRAQVDAILARANGGQQ